MRGTARDRRNDTQSNPQYGEPHVWISREIISFTCLKMLGTARIRRNDIENGPQYGRQNVAISMNELLVSGLFGCGEQRAFA